jgi:hypothetical protein
MNAVASCIKSNHLRLRCLIFDGGTVRLIATVLLLALSGCANGPIKLNDSGERQLAELDAVLVAISESDKVRIDPYFMAFGSKPFPVETGPIWARAFTGEPAAGPTIRIKSAELRQTIAAAGFTTRWTYVAECELSYNGNLHQIHAEGTRAAAMAHMSAMRQAVELGALDAAKKVKNIMLGQ